MSTPDPRPGRSTRALKSLLLYSLLFLGTCTGVSFAGMAKLQSDQTHLAEAPPHETFPLIAVSGSGPTLQAWPIFFRHLDSLRAEEDELRLSFTEEELSAVRSSMRTRTRQGTGDYDKYGIPFLASVEIEEVTPRGPRIRAEVTMDDDIANVGWYEATGDRFRAVRHREFRGGTAAAGVLVFSMALALLAVVVTAVLRTLVRRGK